MPPKPPMLTPRKTRLVIVAGIALLAMFALAMGLSQVQRLRQLVIRPRRTRDDAGPIPSRQGGAGVDFFNLREYQAGDPLRWLNCKAAARHTQTLFTNQFEIERITDVGLILDVRQQSDTPNPGASLFEYSVRGAHAIGRGS